MFKDKNILVLWLTTFITMLGIGIIAPILSIYSKILGASNLEIGLIFGSFALARTLAQIPIGYLSDIYGKKIFIVIGTFFCSVFTTAYAFVHTVYELIVVRMLNGAFSSFITPVAGAYISTIAPKDKHGEYMGIFGSSLALGFALGPLFGGFLAQINITLPFYFCGAITFIAFLLCLFKLKNIEVVDGKVRFTNKLILYNKKLKSNKVIPTDFFKNRRFSLAYILNLLYISAMSGIMVYLSLYAYSLKLSLASIGFLISYTNILSGMTQRKFGGFYDKYGKKVAYYGIVLITLGLILLTISKNFTDLLLDLTFFSIGGAIFSPAVNSIAMEKIDIEKKGSAMGLFTTSLNIGMLVGAIILGFIADLFGIKTMYLLVGIVFFIFSTVILRTI
ncbi:MFS transporter [Methanocaldococcus indicus]|uniref:MFS transporter n=1 Tax=Methanocaldococcus indicus TaxID=213231 RepID=UPI003C6DAF78